MSGNNERRHNLEMTDERLRKLQRALQKKMDEISDIFASKEINTKSWFVEYWIGQISYLKLMDKLAWLYSKKEFLELYEDFLFGEDLRTIYGIPERE